MRLVKPGLLFALGVGVVALPPNGAGRIGGRGAGGAVGMTAAAYAPSAIEHYLSDEEIAYIRPGFHITVNSVSIGDDRRLTADVSFTDDFDQPLDRAGKVTPGALSVSFILAWWNPDTLDYTAYTTRNQTSPITNVTAVQAGTDSGGTWTDLGLGHATYKFKTALPAGYDMTKTHTLGIYATRNLTDILGKNYYANVEYDFRPDGGDVTDTWDILDQDKSCNKCHDPLSAHGGSRQDVKLCVLCHNPQSVDPDTGNTVDFKVMIHKIHDGENLPSVKAGTPYEIIGFNQSVVDFSEVAFPQDIRNCTTCHETSSPGAPIWYTEPNRRACGSCHDDVNFATGANHPGGVQTSDAACASCHQPEGDMEFDASIMGAHTVPYKSKQLKGLTVQILSAQNTEPGDHPTVTFKVFNASDGSIVDPSTLGSNLNLVLGGPTTDYAINPFRERADGASFNGTVATYTFTGMIPADAVGTWALSAEARRTVTLNAGLPSAQSFTEGAINPIFYIPVTDAAPQPRRQVVDIDKCNVCHDRLALHGGQRFVVNECVICHNPNADDSSRRPADKLPSEGIQFARMIHKIHTGEELTHDFTIYGFGGSVNNFNGVLFPGDRRDCEKCHVNGSQHLPLPLTNLPVQHTDSDFYTPEQPTAAACLGCHDTRETAAHAFVLTAPFGEACASCHGNEDDFSVDKVHAR
jgi:OmcA/MtrC family decaheme c-type cytochrome